MASPFDGLAKATQSVIADQLGDAVTFIAYTGGGFSNTEDPERPRFHTVAVFSQGNANEGIAKSTSTSRVAKALYRVSITSEEAQDLPWLPKRDDRMKHGASEYSVTNTSRTEFGELVIDLDRKGDA